VSGTAFNWFTSLPPNSVDNWPNLEQKFHEYFYNAKVELRLSDLTSIRQRHNGTVPEYLRRFRETRNKCYNLTIGEKDLADLAFTCLASYLKERMVGQEFLDVNQVLQRAAVHENRARDHRSHSRFRENGSKEKEKSHVNCVEEESASEDENEICVAKWVNTPKDKPISSSFLKLNSGRKDEIKYTFDVTKCDKLFDVLVKEGIIRLTEGHVVPTPNQLGKRKYCKWHDSYSYMTNEYNYFHRQVQLALNDGRLTLEDGNKMKLDTDPFTVSMVNLEEKKIMVRSDQANSTKGKNVIVSDELRNKMIKPHNPEPDIWKENTRKGHTQRVKPTSSLLIEKYLRQQPQHGMHDQRGGVKRKAGPEHSRARAW
jgi:hypothetical protein